MSVFLFVKQCVLVSRFQHFERDIVSAFGPENGDFSPEDEGSILCRNMVSALSTHGAALRPRRPTSISLP